jgi:hypothetical protein
MLQSMGASGSPAATRATWRHKYRVAVGRKSASTYDQKLAFEGNGSVSKEDYMLVTEALSQSPCQQSISHWADVFGIPHQDSSS